MARAGARLTGGQAAGAAVPYPGNKKFRKAAQRVSPEGAPVLRAHMYLPVLALTAHWVGWSGVLPLSKCKKYKQVVIVFGRFATL